MTKYYHFTCKSRRESINKFGLCSGKKPCLNEKTGDDIYFVRYPKGKSSEDISDRKTATFVMCMVKGMCENEGDELDIWRFEDKEDNLVVEHRWNVGGEIGGFGEYRLRRQNESEIVRRWSRMLAPVRIPPDMIKRISPASLPRELYKAYLDPSICDKLTIIL